MYGRYVGRHLWYHMRRSDRGARLNKGLALLSRVRLLAKDEKPASGGATAGRGVSMQKCTEICGARSRRRRWRRRTSCAAVDGRAGCFGGKFGKLTTRMEAHPRSMAKLMMGSAGRRSRGSRKT